MKKQYLVGLDIPETEQSRLQRFAAMQPEKSVRAFVRQAVRNEMTFRLEELGEREREAMERTIGAAT